MADYQIAELTKGRARRILAWIYSTPYDLYHPTLPGQDPGDKAQKPQYSSVFRQAAVMACEPLLVTKIHARC
ncbi:MAG: hypothetical protein NWR09_05490 [Pseudomonadales bacterium]|jgi:hypothetical protein|nr:hypothetical protein [Pseudomonadales bacterium]